MRPGQMCAFCDVRPATHWHTMTLLNVKRPIRYAACDECKPPEKS